MKILEFSIPQLPGFTTVLAGDVGQAVEIHRLWFEERFEQPCETFSVAEDTRLSLDRDPSLTGALRANQSGIASWTPEGGWIVLPPDMEMAGIRWRETRHVKCWRYTAPEDDESLLVFAATEADAERQFKTWWALHLGGLPRNYEVMPVDPATFTREQRGLLAAMKLGAVGIGSDMVGEWRILLPCDRAAGDL